MMVMANNTAEAFGGMSISKRFGDILDPAPEEKRTAEEILDDFKERLNGEEQYEFV